MRLHLLLLSLTLVVNEGAVRAQTTGAAVAGKETAQSVPPVPTVPSDLYSRLSDATRPQWRQHYRLTVTRCLENRYQAALGLGAVSADLFLAAQARDAQQIRNLLQDGETIEKTLGLVDPMAIHRQKIAVTADQADWPAMAAVISELNHAHRHQLISQKDESLAELAMIGQWVRCMQICHAVVSNRELLDNSELAIGDLRLVQDMIRRLERFSDPATETDRSLKLLHKRLTAVERLWLPDVIVINPADRLSKSAGLLNDLVEQLIQNQPVAEPEPVR